MQNNPTPAFVGQINGVKIQYYFNEITNTYDVIFGDGYHLGNGPTLEKDQHNNWRDTKRAFDESVEQILDSQIKWYERTTKNTFVVNNTLAAAS